MKTVTIHPGDTLSKHLSANYAPLVAEVGLDKAAAALHQYNRTAGTAVGAQVDHLIAGRTLLLPHEAELRRLLPENRYLAPTPSPPQDNGGALRSTGATLPPRPASGASPIAVLPPDAELTAMLERVLADLGLTAIIRRGGLAVGLVDLEHRGSAIVGQGEKNFFASSLPKIAILLTALELDLVNESNRGLFEKMIQHSDNPAARDGVALVGRAAEPETTGDAVLLAGMRQIMGTLESYDLTAGGHGMSLRRAYTGTRPPLLMGQRSVPSEAGWNQMPTQGTSVASVLRFFTLLHDGAFFEGDARRLGQMRQIMANTAIPDRFAKALSDAGVDRAAFLRKSGSMKNTTYLADAVMVGNRYVLVALADDWLVGGKKPAPEKFAEGKRTLERIAARVHHEMSRQTEPGS